MAPPANNTSVVGRFGIVVALVFLFLTYSRIPDLFLSNLHLPLITSVLALGAALLTGGVRAALVSRCGFWLSALTAWLFLAVPFSFWPGGSVNILLTVWLKSYLVFLIVAGLLRSLKHCRWAMYTLGAAALAVVIMAIVMGGVSQEGRLGLERGVLANANYLGQILVIGLPFLALIVLTRGHVLAKPIAGMGIVGSLLVIGLTGSRSALLATAVLFVVMFFTLSWRNKLGLTAVSVLLFVLVLPFVSAEQRSRFMTVFQQDQSMSSGVMEAGAVGSTQQRLNLLWASLQATLTHPLVGVGPGVFQAAAARESTLASVPADWRETHNMYTEISSEAGIPALIFFLGAFATSLSAAYRVARSAGADARSAGAGVMGYCLFLSLIGLGITGFFSSVAYQVYLPTLAALSLALDRSTSAAAGGTIPDRRPVIRPSTALKHELVTPQRSAARL